MERIEKQSSSTLKTKPVRKIGGGRRPHLPLDGIWNGSMRSLGSFYFWRGKGIEKKEKEEHQKLGSSWVLFVEEEAGSLPLCEGQTLGKKMAIGHGRE